MSVIQSLKETSTKATIQGEHYLETSKRYFELKVFQQLTLALSFIMKMALIGGLLFVAFVFALVSATIALGNYLNSMVWSTMAITAVLLLFALLGYVLRKKMEKYIIKKVGAEFFEDQV